MNIPILTGLLLAAGAASAAPVPNDRPYRSGTDGSAPCERACEPAREKSVIGCKLFKTPEESQACVREAVDRKAQCESECRERARESFDRDEGRGGEPRGPREGRLPVKGAGY